ncbi:uncharacterized protein LOC115625360 [Scaptodrosophila lebanonensis]|uniref:Uncharacterized protein LOC115625360 n=1 Tax=Drosophila lebanonensis TaxID=7225 RepID=A0A6J2TL65_DROLE|nr:uncharacterized protein LOC115625360 [Scaptodrosophila lebanonensis]
MSRPMTVNGKFGASGKRHHNILADPERVKKDLENERRITRLRQVREKSNCLARKIRQDVEDEKSRQLQKLEQIKQKELNAWREHVLVKKHQDYRGSIFQVGAAHRAAQAENQINEQQKQHLAQKIRRCSRQACKRACKHANKTHVQLHRKTGGRDCNNYEGRATACTQTPVIPNTAISTDVTAAKCNNCLRSPKTCNKNNCYMLNVGTEGNAGKRKRGTCCRENPNCLCASSDDEQLTDSSCSSFHPDESDDEIATLPPSDCTNKNLQQTAPIILDVDIDKEDTLAFNTQAGMDINDRFVQSNRNFSHVVRSSPECSPERHRKTPQKNAREKCLPRKRFTQISELVQRCSRSTGTEKSVLSPRSLNRSVPRSPTRAKSPTKTARSPVRSEKSSTKMTKSPTRQTRSPSRQAKSPTRLTKSTTQEPKSPTKTAGKSPTKSKKAAAHVNSPRRQQQNRKGPPPSAMVIDAGLRRNSAVQTTPCVPTCGTSAVQTAPCMADAMSQCTCPMEQQSMQTQPVEQQPIQQFILQGMTTQQHLIQHQPLQQPPTQHPGEQLQPSVGTVPRQPTTTATHSSVSATTFVMRQSRAASATSGRVHFYDYNNKFHKNYEAPSTAVHTNTQDATQMNAMEQARMEDHLRELREKELDKLRKISDQRGQKALEREQVRRDCAELTEKLDALAQQNPQMLPSDANFMPSHRFADMAVRRELKMNEVMEKMLLRPAIITCPEVDTALPRTATTHASCKTNRMSSRPAPATVNVGERGRKADDGATVTSSSCCSILLDYVDDQSKQLRTDLKATESNTSKSEKLQNLLSRIEKIRSQLLQEIKAGGSSTVVDDDNVQKMIDNIRQERADILEQKERTLDARESNLHQKEELLEQRLREFYHEKQRTGNEDIGKKTSKECEKPVEIVIKVRSDGTVKQCVPKHKARAKVKPKSRPQPTTETTDELTDQINEHAQRQNSYDSNSTVYRSLPPVIYKGIQMPEQQRAAASPPLHPLIAQYVQRLLGMTRRAVQDLGVSSSDVPTPSSSIVNNPRNMSNSSAADETLIDERRMQRVQAFITDNRSFINELEDTLRNQSQCQSNAEHSMRAFDDVWTRRLESNSTTNIKHDQPKHSRRTTPCVERSPAKSQDTCPPSCTRSVTIAPDSYTPRKLPSSKTMQAMLKQAQVTSTSTTVQRRPQPAKTSQCSSTDGGTDATRQMERYAKLTENCTQRIAELTELITKVREEKQRLVEVTLTSASENERHSTEYMELPTGPDVPPRSRTVSERSDAQCTSLNTNTSEALPLSDQEPLQKHKPTGASRDSGISISRPHTAQGQVAEAEPCSLASSTHSSKAGHQRRGGAPPPTIRRYSPQMVEEDPAHELSTIAEVDTPAQSQVAGVTATALTNSQKLVPVPFPTFEEYAREIHLDLSQIDPNKSIRLQQEFNELVDAFQQRVGSQALDYHEFPNITAYLHNITSTNVQVELPTTTDQNQSLKDLVQQLRVANASIREFPSRREYMQQCLAKKPPEERVLIDSASLENLTDTTDSFNVEAELRQRRILKSSFRRGNATTEPADHDVASSTRRNSAVAEHMSQQPEESGIERMSTTPDGGATLSSDLDREMQRLGLCWSATMRQRQRQADTLGSDSTSPEQERRPRPRGGQEKAKNKENAEPLTTVETQEASQMGRSLNLREFLTRELLKHRIYSDSATDSSDDSLKGNFLQSVIDSLGHHATGATNDRQKTSTPVGSSQSIRDKSGSVKSGSVNAGTLLFSGESRISSVHYPDGMSPAQSNQRANNRSAKLTSTLPSPKAPVSAHSKASNGAYSA